MRFAIDASNAARASKSGIQVYIHALVAALAEMDSDHEFVLCYRASRLSDRKHFIDPPAPNFSTKIIQEPLNVIFSRSIDLFHGPDARIPGYKRPALVATIHDLFSIISDSFADEAFREKKKRRYKDIADRADIIIVPSEHTGQDVREHLGVAKDRIHVTPLGVSADFNQQSMERIKIVRQKYDIPDRYVLSVGHISIRKNTTGLISAFAEVVRTKTAGDCRLVCAGSDGFGAPAAHDAAGAALDGQVLMIGPVEQADMPALYSGAEMLVFASLYEGFGLPVLEAMACGTPVVASERASLPEVTGDAALLVDPEDREALAGAITSVLDDGKLRARLIRAGTLRAAEFKWQQTAAKTLAAYGKAVEMKDM